jgi:EAL domain-containing protein (putative c-di-GMP-specific phosphodiesterase class I)
VAEHDTDRQDQPDENERERPGGCDVGQGYLFSRPQPLPCFLTQVSGG